MKSYLHELKKICYELKKPSQYLGQEFNSIQVKEQDTQKKFNFCLVYPDVYEVGMPNQAIRILNNRINLNSGFLSQRSFLPKPEIIEVFKKNDIYMYSYESFSPLYEFDAIGFVISHELAATNVLESLSWAGISIRSANRKEDDPIVFAGGPVCCNPEPMSCFIDVFIIGEGEDVLPYCLKLIKKYKKLKTKKKDIFIELSKLNGVYVPSLYSSKDSILLANTDSRDVCNTKETRIKKVLYKDFVDDAQYHKTIVPFANITHDRLNVEILRGCARGCRFCQAGMMYRPVRERNSDDIINCAVSGIHDTGYNEVSLTSLSSTDHSEIETILKTINKKFKNSGIRVSIPSQRLDCFGTEMACLVAGNKKGGLTFAPEAGSQRLRDIINKNVRDKDLISAVRLAVEQGWNHIKLYFMIGLPNERDDDVIEIANLCNKVLNIAKLSAGKKREHSISISVSVAVFVPKAQTPFQWCGCVSPQIAKSKITLIKNNIASRQIKISYHDPKASVIETMLSLGSRDISNVIESAWRLGAKFDAWHEHFSYDTWVKAVEECGLCIKDLTQVSRNINDNLPWDHIDLGLDKQFLIDELEKSTQGMTTPDCTMESCTGCGVCKNLNCRNIIQKSRT